MRICIRGEALLPCACFPRQLQVQGMPQLQQCCCIFCACYCISTSLVQQEDVLVRHGPHWVLGGCVCVPAVSGALLCILLIAFSCWRFTLLWWIWTAEQQALGLGEESLVQFWCWLLPCCLQSLGTGAEGNGCVSSVGFMDPSSRTRLCSTQETGTWH